MGGGTEDVVAPAHQQVPDIDHQGSLDGMGRDPFPLMILHFQASDLVLPQQGQAAVVGVGGDPELASAEFPGLGG